LARCGLGHPCLKPNPLEKAKPLEVTGVDASEGFVNYARQQTPTQTPALIHRRCGSHAKTIFSCQVRIRLTQASHTATIRIKLDDKGN
jgi:hypothetical protein